MDVDEHLFRREAPRMVAALTRIFGVHNLELAEDVVQDAFCRALEVWKLRGLPDNPSAWLMTSAKNRAIDVLRRERTARTFAPELGRLIDSEWTLVPKVTELFGVEAIKDDQLRMMFSCCHPRLSEEAQIALVLHILCGFSVDEVANAFLHTHAATEKRIWRAKKMLASSKQLFEITVVDVPGRLPAVQRALYLLFNEGYHGASSESAIRTELCREAMRLGKLLVSNRLTATPGSYALCAVMSLHASRLPARLNEANELLSLADQNRSQWDAQLIAEGTRFLEQSASGSDVTEYHVEAAIASVHAAARSSEETNWKRIVSLYDTLMVIRASPVVALNRAIAIGQDEGPARGLDEIGAIEDRERLAQYPFYHAARGEFELRLGRHEKARDHFRSALSLARNSMEQRFLQQRVQACEDAAASGELVARIPVTPA